MQFFLERIAKKIVGAVAPLFLMFKKLLLKMSTSKHTKKINCRNESGISKSDFKNKLMGR